MELKASKTIEDYILNGTSKLYYFENDVILSAQSKPGTYGYEGGLWEVAVYASDSNGRKLLWLTEKFFPEARGDVIGWVTDARLDEMVREIIEKLAAYVLTTVEKCS